MPAQCIGHRLRPTPFLLYGNGCWGWAKGWELQSVSVGLILQVVVGALFGSGCRCQNVGYLPLFLRGH